MYARLGRYRRTLHDTISTRPRRDDEFLPADTHPGMTQGIGLRSGFPYSQLGPSEIRVIDILPGGFNDIIELVFSIINLQDAPVYDALSYVWNPNDQTVDITAPVQPVVVRNLGDFPRPVGVNLDSAIRHLRHRDHPNRPIWIDALCINQLDLEERSQQVELMGEIYSSADRVLIWLGPTQRDSDFALDTLRTGMLDFQAIRRFLFSLENLLLRDWFKRVWIAQELTLARKNPIVLVGHQSIDWNSFTLAVCLVRERMLGEERTGVIGADKSLRILSPDTVREVSKVKGQRLSPQSLAALVNDVQFLASMRKAGPGAKFAEQFYRTSHLRATDPRDKVFGLLGISTFGRWPIVPDYAKSDSQVFAETAALLLREDFGSYIASQMLCCPTLDDGNGAFCWVPNFYDIATYLDWKSTIVPSAPIVQHAIAQLHDKVPIVEFTDDYSTFNMAGRVLGRVKFCALLSRMVRDRHQFSQGMRHIISLVKGQSTESLLSALLGPCNPHQVHFDSMRSTLEHLIGDEYFDEHNQTGDDLNRWPNGNDFQQLMEAVNFHRPSVWIFTTDTGLVGIAEMERVHRVENIETSGLLVGLFGINIPFILLPQDEGGYEIVNIAHVGGHVLRDEYVENMEPGTDWRDVIVNGPLELFESMGTGKTEWRL